MNFLTSAMERVYDAVNADRLQAQDMQPEGHFVRFVCRWTETQAWIALA
jgi:hypothetical protein